MHYLSLTSFCELTGLTVAEVSEFESRGLIASTTKDSNRFYSYTQAYRAKGIIFLMRTEKLTAEEAAAKMDEKAIAANRK